MTPNVCHKIISQLVKIPFFTNTKGRLWLGWVFVMKYYARTSNHCQSVISSRAGAGGDCLSPVVHKPRCRKFMGSSIRQAVKSLITASSNHHPEVKYHCWVMPQTCSDRYHIYHCRLRLCTNIDISFCQVKPRAESDIFISLSGFMMTRQCSLTVGST